MRYGYETFDWDYCERCHAEVPQLSEWEDQETGEEVYLGIGCGCNDLWIDSKLSLEDFMKFKPEPQ